MYLGTNFGFAETIKTKKYLPLKLLNTKSVQIGEMHYAKLLLCFFNPSLIGLKNHINLKDMFVSKLNLDF